MSTEDRKVGLIDDARLKNYVNRTRSGSEQVFYCGNDSRDWDRYRAEDGPRKSNVTMHDKPDTIRIQPPEKHYYSELIGDEWWWLNGCAECNGGPRDWMTYIECDKHNVCRSCCTPRSEIKETPWGGKHGWQCSPCAKAEHKAEKEAALSAMPEEYYEWDFCGKDEITCPHCAYEFRDSWEHSQDDEQKHECPRCENTFKVTAIHDLSFNCERIS